MVLEQNNNNDKSFNVLWNTPFLVCLIQSTSIPITKTIAVQNVETSHPVLTSLKEFQQNLWKVFQNKNRHSNCEMYCKSKWLVLVMEHFQDCYCSLCCSLWLHTTNIKIVQHSWDTLPRLALTKQTHILKSHQHPNNHGSDEKKTINLI